MIVVVSVVMVVIVIMVVSMAVMVVMLPASVLVVLQLRGQSLARHSHPPCTERGRLSLRVNPVRVCVRQCRRHGIRGFHCVRLSRDRFVVVESPQFCFELG